ncbi:MAG: polysaccharide deacetylase family protein [Flavobacteriaceae bacterium]|nr:polysaccharide deacetylase family protein [Flavobacteriaceae bacterium]
MLKFRLVNSIFFFLAIVLLVLNRAIDFPNYIYGLLFLSWFCITAIGSFNILWNYHLNAYNSNPTISGKKVAITFDDGPNEIVTPKILALLKKYNAKATFFCIGKNIEANPIVFKQIIEEGHSIGNHSYTHSNNFGFFSKSVVIEEIIKTNKLSQNLIGKEMKLFRPPFGVTNPSISKALKQTKHHVIGWNVRSLDTVIKDENKIFNRITKHLKSGDVILLHDTNERTINVLEQLLLFLQENKFEISTVDTLFNIDAYA